VPDVSPRLGAPLEWREVRRFAATMVGHAIRRLEHAKWWLEESPSREQVEVWQRTVFQPIETWWDGVEVDPSIDRVNAAQVTRYFPLFGAALDAHHQHPDKLRQRTLKSVTAELNMKLSNAYGLPAVPR
jgi:hypothetical protein